MKFLNGQKFVFLRWLLCSNLPCYFSCTSCICLC